jgi:hypothetical protein
MMRVTAVDSVRDLFVIEEVVEPSLIKHLNNIDWYQMAGIDNLPQSDWPRLNLFWHHQPVLKELDTQLRWARYEIERQLGLYFSYCYTDYWLDQGDLSVPVHTDSIIASSMQLYWIGPADSGTTFLNTKDPKDVRYQCKFRPNSGYLMLNMPRDGMQPLLWHCMLTKMPKDQLRFSSYTRLGSYWSHK